MTVFVIHTPKSRAMWPMIYMPKHGSVDPRTPMLTLVANDHLLNVPNAPFRAGRARVSRRRCVACGNMHKGDAAHGIGIPQGW